MHIADQTYGEGAIDLVVTPGFISNLEYYWDESRCSHWLTEMGRIARVKIFDKRGTCLSERVADPPTMEERIDDMRAVMDATGIERVVLFGVSEGGSMASLFARMVSRIWTNPQCTYLTVETGWSTTLRA